MDMYVQRSGGKEAYSRIKNRVTKSTSDSVKGVMHVTTYEAEPDKQFVEMESERGIIKRGSNGDVAWLQTQSRTAIRKDEMRTRELVATFFHMPYKWRALCTKAECKEIVEFAGNKCYKVELSTIYDFPLTYYIDVDTMLLHAVDQTVHRGERQRTFGSVMEDYRKVDGILYPYKIERTINGNRRATMTVKSIKHNVDLPGDVFELPAEVVKLVEDK